MDQQREQPCLSAEQEARLKALADNAALRGTVPLDDVFAVCQEMAIDMLFRILEFGLDRIRGKPFVNRTAFQLTQLVYACMDSKIRAETFLEWAHQSFTPYLHDVVVPRVLSETDESLLSTFVRAWENHKVMTLWVCHRLF